MDPKFQQSWENFLNPAILRNHLISASIYIASFEALKDAVIGRTRDFFWNGFDQAGDRIDPKYGHDVLSRNKSTVYASLDWLKEMGAIRNLRGIGHLLIALRIARGISQRQLAERLGVHESQVSRDERNEYHGITLDRAARVLDALGVELRSTVEVPAEDRAVPLGAN